MTQSNRIDAIAKWISLVTGIGGLAFVYGMAVIQYEIFPYNQFRDAKLAAKAWHSHYKFEINAEHQEEMYKRLPSFWFPTRRTESGVRINIPEKQAPGLPFLPTILPRLI
jgi:hypothetical protein